MYDLIAAAEMKVSREKHVALVALCGGLTTSLDKKGF